MKYILLIFTILLIGCGSSNKAYICGDHKCANKKEAREYFEKNLNVEVELNKNKNKDKKIDLVKLNTDVYLDKKEEKRRIEAKNKLLKKEIKDKEKLKKETDIFYSEKEIKNIEETILSKKEIDQIEKEILKKKKEEARIAEVNKNEIQKLNKANKIKSIKVADMDPNIDFCATINDCDIDKISKDIMTRGKSKKYPNLSIK